jgi:hypothetical protein
MFDRKNWPDRANMRPDRANLVPDRSNCFVIESIFELFFLIDRSALIEKTPFRSALIDRSGLIGRTFFRLFENREKFLNSPIRHMMIDRSDMIDRSET